MSECSPSAPPVAPAPSRPPQALEKARNDRLAFKTQLKLANLWFKKGEFARMARILKDLHRRAQSRARSRVTPPCPEEGGRTGAHA